MIQVPKDVTTVCNEFFQFLSKKDDSALLKLFAPDGLLVDFENQSHRGAGVQGFVREWPRTLTLKLGKVSVNGQTGNVAFTLTGGGFTKPTDAKARVTVNDKFLITHVRFELA